MEAFRQKLPESIRFQISGTFNSFPDPNTTAIEHVLTFHSFFSSFLFSSPGLSSSSLYHLWIIPKSIRPSLDLRFSFGRCNRKRHILHLERTHYQIQSIQLRAHHRRLLLCIFNQHLDTTFLTFDFGIWLDTTVCVWSFKYLCWI